MLQKQAEAPIQQDPGSSSGAAEVPVSLSSGLPKKKGKKSKATSTVHLPEQQINVENAAIEPEGSKSLL